jgi:hypothetical protein
MNKLWLAGAAALAMMTGVAVAQTTTSQTTTTVYPTVLTPVAGTMSTTNSDGTQTMTTVYPAVVTPVAGSVSVTRTVDTTNSDGTQTTSKETTFHNSNGVADDSVTKTTIYPPVAVTTTNTKTSTSMTTQ